jgi:hypothetical protein
MVMVGVHNFDKFLLEVLWLWLIYKHSYILQIILGNYMVEIGVNI